MNNNPFKTFRDPLLGKSTGLKKKFDQPTYLSFSLLFYPKNNDMNATNYDKVPHPLFNIHKEDDINARNYYSTYQYLRDIKEPQRARMLEKFYQDWTDLQINNQWYFQSVDGINSLLSFDPNRGIRVSQKEGSITINMLEGIDQRVFNLLNMYRKIAWDDVYQRWILPDLMRYFSLDIYVTEFRTFHEPKNSTSEDEEKDNNNQQEIFLRVLDKTLPTYVIKCEMCEFDLPSLNFENMNNLSIAENPKEFTSSFKINVGKIYEEYINPIQYLFWSDALINFKSRTYDYDEDILGNKIIGNITGTYTLPQDPLSTESDKNKSKKDYSLISQDQYFAKKTHTTGQPWNESQYDLKNSSPEAGIEPIDPTNTSGWLSNALKWGKGYAKNFIESTIDKAKMSQISIGGQRIGSFNEISSAIESQNFMTVIGMARKAINQTIAGTGVPLSGATNDESIDDHYIREPNTGPITNKGEEGKKIIPHGFEEKIADETFKNFLRGIEESQATGQNIDEMKRVANLILNDEGNWNQIKDYSYATDMTSTSLNEKNIDNPIDKANADNALQKPDDRSLATDLDGGPKEYNEINIQNIQDRSKATDLDEAPKKIKPKNIMEGVPTSEATNKKIQE